jgi:formiminotetrahydrofolate cyclodeaminase
MYADQSVKDYVMQTASSEPVPGGGSVAALAASMAAALAEMVAGLTIGRKAFEAVSEEMEEIAQTAAVLRERCLAAVDEDPEAYRQVMAAFRLPKSTDAQKSARSRAVQDAMVGATGVPLMVAGLALQILDLAARVVDTGNPNAVTDGLVAALMARSAGLGAVFNVRINLASVKDQDFVQEITARVDKMQKELIAREGEILAGVRL